MKAIVSLLLGFSVLAAETPHRHADSFFQNYEFKKSLIEWAELYQKSPENWGYARHVADLQLLLESRAKAQETLRNFVIKEQKTLSPLQKQEVATKIIELSEVFLKEEAQSHYLQALSKTKLKEWNASYSPVTQAAALEPDNLKILSLKYEIEKNLGLFGQAYDTLKTIHGIDTLSNKTIERLAESHIFHSKFAEAKALLEKNGKSDLSIRARLALAVSLQELGDKEGSQEILEQISQSKKTEFSQHPVTLWLQYRNLSEENPKSRASQSALKLFLKASVDGNRVLIDGWDPYRISYYRSTLAK